MEIVCISDLHGYVMDNLPMGDLLIVSGDLTARDTMKQHLAIWDWLAGQSFKKVIVVGGNHDNFLQSDLGIELMCHWAPHMTYLCDSSTTFEGLKIWGSPWTSSFEGMNQRCMAFTETMGCDSDQWLGEKWAMIPDDVDILVTHSPAYGILDQTESGLSVGSKSLLMEMTNRIKPKLHVFGHIHEQGGRRLVYKRPGYGTENNTLCINASHVDERYKPVNGYMAVEY